jgi:hypothetical protein
MQPKYLDSFVLLRVDNYLRFPLLLLSPWKMRHREADISLYLSMFGHGSAAHQAALSRPCCVDQGHSKEHVSQKQRGKLTTQPRSATRLPHENSAQMCQEKCKQFKSCDLDACNIQRCLSSQCPAKRGQHVCHVGRPQSCTRSEKPSISTKGASHTALRLAPKRCNIATVSARPRLAA